MAKRAGRFYAVVTRTGSTVVSTWDEALSFLHEHPGAEFHKKFMDVEQANQFIEEKSIELGVIPEREASSVPEPVTVQEVAPEDDDEVPW